MKQLLLEGKRVSIVCHDSGGANQIIAMLQGGLLDKVLAYMEGPAKNLWDISFPNKQISQSLDEALSNCSILISGTGWESDLEYNARKMAGNRGVYNIAVLDHWVNYRERFVRNGQLFMPDEIWVVDEQARKLASEKFPRAKIELKDNIYLDQQVEAIQPMSETDGNTLVYLLEPIRDDWGRGEAGEFQALNYFLSKLKDLQISPNTQVRLRPHPAEPLRKYNSFLEKQDQWKIILDSGTLAESISRCRWVAGCQTYAMTIALKAGRVVFCSLPPWAPRCSLPHAGIIHIKDIS